jgi:hypothetical protein
MSGKVYPCCGDPSCPYCGGSGVVEGPEADAFMGALASLTSADNKVEEMTRNGTDFYEQVAGEALRKLKAMYDDLGRKDIARVIEYLNGFGQEFLSE